MLEPWKGDAVLLFLTFKSFSDKSQQRLWMQLCHWKRALYLPFCLQSYLPFKKTTWNAISTLEIARLHARPFCNEKQSGSWHTEAELVSQDYSDKKARNRALQGLRALITKSEPVNHFLVSWDLAWTSRQHLKNTLA